MDALTDELQPYTADLLLARRWFEHARAARLRGEIQAAEHCCNKGEEVLARVDARVLCDRSALVVSTLAERNAAEVGA